MDEVTEDQTTQTAGADALDAVILQAEALEGAAVAPAEKAQAEQQAVAVVSAAAELLQALQLLRLIAAPAMKWWEHFAEVWSDAQLIAISEAGAQVMQRHGWSMGELMSKWGPYLALVSAVGLPGLATYQALAYKREQEQAAKRQAVAKPAPMAPPPPSTNAQEGTRL